MQNQEKYLQNVVIDKEYVVTVTILNELIHWTSSKTNEFRKKEVVEFIYSAVVNNYHPICKKFICSDFSGDPIERKQKTFFEYVFLYSNGVYFLITHYGLTTQKVFVLKRKKQKN